MFVIQCELAGITEENCTLKELRYVTINEPVISVIYVVVYMCPLRSAHLLVDGVNLKISFFQELTNISAMVFCLLLNEIQESIFKNIHLRKIVENLFDGLMKKAAKSSFRKKLVYEIAGQRKQ